MEKRANSLFRKRSSSFRSIKSKIQENENNTEDIPPVPPVPVQENENKSSKSKKIGPIPVPRFGSNRAFSSSNSKDNERQDPSQIEEQFKNDELRGADV